MPSRVFSASACTALVNSAACCGLTLVVLLSWTVLRKMKRVIFSVLTKRSALVLVIVFGATGALSVSISIIPAFSSSVIFATRSAMRCSTARRQSSYESRRPLPLASRNRKPSTVSTLLLRTPSWGCTNEGSSSPLQALKRNALPRPACRRWRRDADGILLGISCRLLERASTGTCSGLGCRRRTVRDTVVRRRDRSLRRSNERGADL